MPQAAPPSRGDTPPRSGSAPIRLLRICLDNRVLGGVEVNESSNLADVRSSIAEDEIVGVPESFLFLYGGAPVSRRQEGRRRAVDCFPFLTIIPEGAHVPTASDDAGRGADAGGAATPSPSTVDTIPGLPGNSAPAESGAAPAALPEGGTQGECLLELHITDGPLEGTMATVGEDGARVGRHTSNALVIPEAGISRYHCEVCMVGSEFCVRDLGSTTGTFFYLRPHGRFPMFVGLMVKLGETEFQVLSQTAPGELPAEQVALFYEGPFAGHKVRIPETGISIGRRHDNHLVLVQDGTVSAHHAVIFCEDGEFFITDLGSCNGTCVRLSPERTDSDWHPVMDGDVLGAGCTKIRCRLRAAM